MTLDEAIAHLGGEIGNAPDHVRECVRDELPHYLWVMTDLDSRRRRYIFCEWCESQRAEIKTGNSWTHAYRQGERMACPYCGGDVIVKRMGRGFHNIYDRVNVVWYQKSAVDANAVVAIGAHCFRDFEGCEERPWQEEPVISFRSFTVIVPGEGSYRFKQHVNEWGLWGGDHRTWRPTRKSWIQVKRFRGLTFGTVGVNIFQHTNPMRVVVLDETLREAIRGTTLERAWSDVYLDDSDGVVALGLIAKYPCIEYMTKLGMVEIVKAKADGDLPADLINWRGKSMSKVLKMSRGRLGELKHAGIILTPGLLMLYQWMDRIGYHLTAPAAYNTAVLAERWTVASRVAEAVQNVLNYHDMNRRQRALKYIARQADKAGDTRIHLGDFRDYWNLCERFREDLNDDAIAFPSNIREAEARMRERERRENEARRLVADSASKKEQDDKIASQYKRLLRAYGFSFGGLTLRPARDGDEVRAEGKALHHCVGGYVNSYADGKTVICVLRRDVEPDRPWRTVEISTSGKLVQDRGYHNDTTMGTPLTPAYKAMLALFWEAWGERNKKTEAKSA